MVGERRRTAHWDLAILFITLLPFIICEALVERNKSEESTSPFLRRSVTALTVGFAFLVLLRFYQVSSEGGIIRRRTTKIEGIMSSIWWCKRALFSDSNTTLTINTVSSLRLHHLKTAIPNVPSAQVVPQIEMMVASVWCSLGHNRLQSQQLPLTVHRLQTWDIPIRKNTVI